jgi:hypothetical protein
MVQKRKRKEEVVTVERTDVVPLQRNADGSFAAGHAKVGGRQVGTPNRVKQAMRDWMEEAAAQVGYDGQGAEGYVGWLRARCEESPKLFLKVLAGLQPRNVNAEVTNVLDVKYETVEEAREALRQHGLVIDHVVQ